MLPRFKSDYRTLFWALVLFPLLPALGYIWPPSAPWLLPVALYLAYCAGVLTHNHTHVNVFTARLPNQLYSMWLSIFYGCPVAVWIPTHQLNHHRFANGARDVTRTDRLSPRHSLPNALAYALACGYWQLPLIVRYARRALAQRSWRWTELWTQSLALVVAHAGMLALAIKLYGPGQGALTYALAFGAPALLAPSFMLFTNYLQHVHCATGSRHDHSRNFTHPLANWFVFDAGYHTAHHERPDQHWSTYAALHRQLAPEIHPSLQQSTVWRFCFDNYVLGALQARRRTRPLGE